MRFTISALALLLAVSAFEYCQAESVFNKFGSDVKGAADKFANGVATGAKDVGHVATDFGHDVDHAVKDFRLDVEFAFYKAKPILMKAFVVINNLQKTLEEISETRELLDLLEVADDAEA